MFYHLVDCSGEVYVTAEKTVDREEGETDVYIFKLGNISDWQFSDTDCLSEFRNAKFSSPYYDTGREVIYGLDDNETVITYDIKSHRLVGDKWVNSGLSALFTVDIK